MTKEELLKAQKFLGKNATDMAIVAEIPYRTYYKWFTGENNISSSGETIINMLVFIHRHGLLEEWINRNKD